jgi:hypothetical protein
MFYLAQEGYPIHRVNEIKILNLTVPESYFSEQYPWRYEHFTCFDITKKQVKYLFLHQFCSDSHE